MHLTAVYFWKNANFSPHREENYYSCKYPTLLRFGAQAQATAENGFFTVSLNFYVLPLDFLLCLNLTFFHILIFSGFLWF